MHWVAVLSAVLISLLSAAEGQKLGQQKMMEHKSIEARMEHDKHRRVMEEYRQQALADYERRRIEATRVYTGGSGFYYSWRDDNRRSRK